jgi:two-component system sensor histidine kinase/response regulator
MQMPNMNGYDATKKLRESAITIPIVAVTANAMKGDDKKCLKAGCDDYLAKPINRKKLNEILGKFLQIVPQEQDSSVVEVIDAVKNEVDQLNNTISQNVANADTPVIDLQEFIQRMGGDIDEEIINAIVEQCSADCSSDIDKLKGAIKQSDPDRISTLAHTIKGAAANVSANQLSNAAKKLELASKNGELENAEPMLNEIEEEFNKLKSFISKQNWQLQ